MNTFTPRLTLLLGAFVFSAFTFALVEADFSLQGQFNGRGTSDVDDDEGFGGLDFGGGDEYCGDGLINQPWEECDDGRYNDEFGSQCDSNCQVKKCGNYIVEDTEECDEGPNGNEFCSWDCRAVPGGGGAPIQSCGNKIVEGDEECDDGNSDNTDRCTKRCKKSRCGDSIVQPMGRDGRANTEDDEECDEGGQNGFGRCTKACKIITNTEAKCGDGIAEGKEECDDGNGDDKDFCLPTCTLSFCGDGITQTVRDEQCDDANDNNRDKCTNKCQKAACGDGIVQDLLGEECDEGLKNGGLGVHCSALCKKRTVSNGSSSSKGSSAQTTDQDDDGDQDDIFTGDNDEDDDQDDTVNTTDNDDDNNALDEAKRRQEEEQRRLREEQRLKREEQERIIQERLREAQQKQEEELKRQQEEALNNNGTQPKSDEDEDEEVLVCFTEDGTLVGDREDCAPDQEQFVRQEPEQTISDEQAKEELRKKLLGEDAAEKRRMKLLQTLEEAREKLTKATDGVELRPEVEKYVSEGVAWLNQGIEYFSQGGRNLDEINQMVPAVRQLLEQMMNVVREERNLPQQAKRDFTPILQKAERLLLKFRESFIALSQGGVPLDEGALEQYVKGAELFNEIANVCVQSGERCSEVNQVLEYLKVAQGPLQEAFGENPEIYQAVQAKFTE